MGPYECNFHLCWTLLSTNFSARLTWLYGNCKAFEMDIIGRRSVNLKSKFSCSHLNQKNERNCNPGVNKILLYPTQRTIQMTFKKLGMQKNCRTRFKHNIKKRRLLKSLLETKKKLSSAASMHDERDKFCSRGKKLENLLIKHSLPCVIKFFMLNLIQFFDQETK